MKNIFPSVFLPEYISILYFIDSHIVLIYISKFDDKEVTLAKNVLLQGFPTGGSRPPRGSRSLCWGVAKPCQKQLGIISILTQQFDFMCSCIFLAFYFFSEKKMCYEISMPLDDIGSACMLTCVCSVSMNMYACMCLYDHVYVSSSECVYIYA